MAGLTIPTGRPFPHDRCTMTFDADAPSGHRVEEWRVRAQKDLSAALKPRCDLCGSSAKGHKRGSEKCRAARLKRSLRGCNGRGATLYAYRKPGQWVVDRFEDRQAAAYAEAMRIKRGELVFRAYRKGERFSTGDAGVYVEALAVAA